MPSKLGGKSEPIRLSRLSKAASPARATNSRNEPIHRGYECPAEIVYRLQRKAGDGMLRIVGGGRIAYGDSESSKSVTRFTETMVSLARGRTPESCAAGRISPFIGS